MNRARHATVFCLIALSMISLLATSLVGSTSYADLISTASPQPGSGITAIANSAVSIDPTDGPVSGGGDCALNGVTGFVILPPDNGIVFSGKQVINPEVDDKGIIKVVIDFQYSQKPSDSTEMFLMGYKQGTNSNAFMFSAKNSKFLSYYFGGVNGLEVGTSDTVRHTLTKTGTTTGTSGFTQGVTTLNPGTTTNSGQTSNVSWDDWGPLYLGGYSVGTSPTGSFVGTVYSYTIYQNDMTKPVRELVPAAWVNGLDAQGNPRTVYGFYDKQSGRLFGDMKGASQPLTATNAATRAPVVKAYLGGNALGVSTGQATLDGNTYSFLPSVSCGPIPAHEPGWVDLVVDVNGVQTTVPDAYVYWTDGELTVTKRAWRCGDDQINTYEEIIGGACGSQIDSGSTLPNGTVITWTYTTTYVYTGAVENQGSTGLTDVVVRDDMLGEVCEIDSLPINTPVGCVASGPVQGSGS